MMEKGPQGCWEVPWSSVKLSMDRERRTDKVQGGWLYPQWWSYHCEGMVGQHGQHQFLLGYLK